MLRAIFHLLMAPPGPESDHKKKTCNVMMNEQMKALKKLPQFYRIKIYAVKKIQCVQLII